MTDSIAKIKIKGVEQDFILPSKDFKTGSKGFYAQGKIVVSETERYQVSVQAVLIGSKKEKLE